MNVATEPLITDRQREVLERIDKRMPIKVIAAEMKVSEARINQHIRAVKDKFEVDSMGELVARYRAMPDYDPATDDPYRNSLYRKSELPDEPIFPDQQSRVDPGEIVLSDSHHVLIDAPWTGPREPVVVPSFLDGDNAVLKRLAAMVVITFVIISAIILAVSAAVTVSEVLDGKASISSEHQGS